MLFQARNISKTFQNHTALNDVSIDVRQGSVFGLLGPNGAGKTTLIRIINHIIAPDSGTLLIDGRTLTTDDVLQIGYLPEERGLYKKMKVGDQMLYLARLKGLSRAEAEHRLRRWFEHFDILEWWAKPVEQLSKGMQQKLQFIATVVHSPRLLIFDEPFSGFDPINATLLRDEIQRLRANGATVILSTHNMTSVEEICDDIALINNAQVVLSGSVASIRQSYGSNRYEVVCLADKSPLQVPDSYAIDAKLLAHDPTKQRLVCQLPNGTTANDLLSLLIPQRTIVSFREILPSMNDIFIKTVTQ